MHIQESAQVTHRAFTSIEQESSSTYRELLAIQYAIQAFEPLLHGCNVKILTDSQMAMKIVQVGSMKLDLHKLAISIFSTCFRANIELDIQWIPRSLNAKADYISRFTDFDDWEVKPEVWSTHCGLFCQLQKCKDCQVLLALLESWIRGSGCFLSGLVSGSRMAGPTCFNSAKGTLVYV